MAHDHCGTHYVDIDPVRTVDHVIMILEGIIGLFMLVSGGKAEIDPASTVLKLIYKGNHFKKEEKQQSEVEDDKEE